MASQTFEFFENIKKYQDELNCHPAKLNDKFEGWSLPFGWYDMPGVEMGPYYEEIHAWFFRTIADITHNGQYHEQIRYNLKQSMSEKDYSDLKIISDFFKSYNYETYLNYLKIILPTFELVSLGRIIPAKYEMGLGGNGIQISDFEKTFIVKTICETIAKFQAISESKKLKSVQKTIFKDYEIKMREHFYNFNKNKSKIPRPFDLFDLTPDLYDFITWTNMSNISLEDLEEDYIIFFNQFKDLRNKKMKFLSSLPFPEYFLNEQYTYRINSRGGVYKLGEFKTCIECLWQKTPIYSEYSSQLHNIEQSQGFISTGFCQQCLERLKKGNYLFPRKEYGNSRFVTK